MKYHRVQKGGWNHQAFIAGPFWYISRGMLNKAFIMVFMCIITLGIAVIPIWIYCGYHANKDFYRFLKKRDIYIYH